MTLNLHVNVFFVCICQSFVHVFKIRDLFMKHKVNNFSLEGSVVGIDVDSG